MLKSPAYYDSIMERIDKRFSVAPVEKPVSGTPAKISESTRSSRIDRQPKAAIGSKIVGARDYGEAHCAHCQRIFKLPSAQAEFCDLGKCQAARQARAAKRAKKRA